MSIDVLVADWPLADKVVVGTTCRKGGASEGVFLGANMGLHVGDAAENVLRNRAQLQKQLGIEASVWMNQTHSTKVIEAKANVTAEVDGLYLKQEGERHNDQYELPPAIMCMTADCLPVVMADRQATTLCIAHAGWRGLADGILQNSLSVFSSTCDVHCWVGPAISQKYFEIGEDVAQQVKRSIQFEKWAGTDKFFTPVKSGRCFADLAGLAGFALTQLGVKSVSQSAECTYGSEKYYSYRRDGVTGRMATYAYFKP